MNKILVVLALFSSITSYGQYYADLEISQTDLKEWRVKNTYEYSGVYQYGVSEGECTLRLIVADSIVVAQSRCYTEDRRTGGFKDTFQIFSNVRIEGNQFFSDQTNGMFDFYTSQSGTVAGLWLDKPWTYRFNEGGEFGPLISGRESFWEGKYPFVSQRLLKDYELDRYDPGQLKIMRNEIFARYGLIFQKGGEMDRYFSQQSWYRKNYEKVDQWLTEIELANIGKIKAAEKKRVK